jgi:hypothetical protein
MTQRRFTVVTDPRFEQCLATLWLQDHDVQKAFDELEPVLRTIPDQAGELFLFEETEYWHITHRMVDLIYQISIDDRQVKLIDVRLTPG